MMNDKKLVDYIEITGRTETDSSPSTGRQPPRMLSSGDYDNMKKFFSSVGNDIDRKMQFLNKKADVRDSRSNRIKKLLMEMKSICVRGTE